MKKLKIVSQIFIGFSAFSLVMVSFMAFSNPQDVMDLVQVKLENNDAFSSIRGVYGGVGMAIVIMLIYQMFKNIKAGLSFLALLWGFYALSRLITITVEGPLGAFGSQWLMTESLFFVISIVLLYFENKRLKLA